MPYTNFEVEKFDALMPCRGTEPRTAEQLLSLSILPLSYTTLTCFKISENVEYFSRHSKDKPDFTVKFGKIPITKSSELVVCLFVYIHKFH